MSYGQIIVETRGRAGILTLNRPEVLNAMNSAMAAEILQQLEAWETDDGIGAVVLTGAGRAF